MKVPRADGESDFEVPDSDEQSLDDESDYMSVRIQIPDYIFNYTEDLTLKSTKLRKRARRRFNH